MKAIDANSISIREYLSTKGIYPVKDRGYYGMYNSPFRKDQNASLKVEYNQNVWHDFGTGEGGSLIDLIMKINGSTFYEAITLLEKESENFSSFSFQGNNSNYIKTESALAILKIEELNNPALMEYLSERKVNMEIAKLHCSEVHYSVNDKPYFAIGFRNDSGGYELRNKYFKGCTSKDITTAKTGMEYCQLFEGFMDYLSFLSLKNWQQPKSDVIVLNSLTNLPKVRNTLAKYNSVATFLDNDEAGKRAVQELKSVCKEVNDQSSFYAQHKDLNEYLCQHASQKQSVKKVQSKGKKL